MTQKVVNRTKLYDMLGFLRGINALYLAKDQSFHITLAFFTPD